ncbi:MAG: CRISPR-associated helicase, Cas3 family, partial [Polaromonas sp.]|nr:CRISPR-associated helicase, Cas3 family [Polaromonas sp.]
LLEEGLPGVQVAVLCTHARFPLAVRHHVDGFLRRLLTRKLGADGQDPLLANERVRALLDDGAEDDVVILVSSSPLLERGRDLDFDYAIVEPCSEDVVTQTAGRVRRHRPGPWAADNIGLMSHSSDVLLNGNGKFDTNIQSPGVETELPLYASRKDTEGWLHLDDRTACKMFDLETWNARLDATGSLTPRGAASQLAERKRARLLLGEGGNPRLLKGQFDGAGRTAKMLSFSSFAKEPPRMLDTMHFRERRFRRQTGQERQYYREAGVWMATDPNDRDGVGAPAELSMSCDWAPKNDDWEARMLLPPTVFDADAEVERLAGSLVANGERVSWFERRELSTMMISFRGDRAELKLHYHPVLGSDRKKVGLP